jgi:hypothetical protein
LGGQDVVVEDASQFGPLARTFRDGDGSLEYQTGHHNM